MEVVLIISCMVAAILITVVLANLLGIRIVAPSEEPKGRTTGSGTFSREHRKPEAPKKKSFQSHYKSRQDKILKYDIGFFWKKDQTWYYIEETKNGVIYTFIEKGGNVSGTVTFGEHNVIKHFLDSFLKQYKNDGSIRLGVLKHREYLRFILSDLTVREEYEYYNAKNTFFIFDTIHGTDTRDQDARGNNGGQGNRNSSGNSSGNSNGPTDIQKAFKFFKLETTVTLKEATIAYKKYAKKYHPDMGGTVEQMVVVNRNYAIIKTYFSNK